MSYNNVSAPDPNGFQEAARRSQDAGIADETAAFDDAAAAGAPLAIEEGDRATKDDGNRTSETD